MRKNILLALVACSGMLSVANAQEAVVVEENVAVAELTPCKNYYDLSSGNWFIQAGAGINAPFVESYLANGEEKTHLTAAYNLGFGKWLSPFLGVRFSALGGAYHWDNNVYTKAKYANLNVDLMWDMFNTFGSSKSNRVVSILPFVGLGGTFCWDFTQSGIADADGKPWAFSEYGGGGTQNCHSDDFHNTTNHGSGGARHDIEKQMWIIRLHHNH